VVANFGALRRRTDDPVGFRAVSALRTGKEHNRLLIWQEKIPLEAPEEIIDLGCGPGNRHAGCSATDGPMPTIAGLDSSPVMIERARRSANRYRLEKSETFNRGQRPTGFDLIFAKLLSSLGRRPPNTNAPADRCAQTSGGSGVSDCRHSTINPLHKRSTILAKSSYWQLYRLQEKIHPVRSPAWRLL